MTTFTINNVRFTGLTSCVPAKRIDNLNDCSLDDRVYRKKYAKASVLMNDAFAQKVFFSDLAEIAANDLISKLGWQLEEIEALIEGGELQYFQNACDYAQSSPLSIFVQKSRSLHLHLLMEGSAYLLKFFALLKWNHY